MKNELQQFSTKVMTNSQQFILDLGYTDECSTRDAAVWHYIALRRQFAFARHEAETRSDALGGVVEDPNTAEAQDHSRALTEIGLLDPTITNEELKANLPQEVDSLVWNWIL
jgi:hypothetical protein